MSGFVLAAGDPVDLHLHTIYSDGSWRPEELFDHLHERGFCLVAVTDHDTLDATEEMRALGQERGIAVLMGVEVTSGWRDGVAHVLCYAHELTSGALGELVQATVAGMEANNQEVYDELRRRGHRFPRQEEILAAQGGRLRRPVDNAMLLVSHGYATDLEQGLAMIRDAGYRIIRAPIEGVVEAAHASGAVTLLAHPGRRSEIRDYPTSLLRELLDEMPLDGLEVYYPTHSAAQVAEYEEMARERGLLVSAGSDSHRPGQRLPVAYEAAQVAKLLVRLDITLAWEAGR